MKTPEFGSRALLLAGSVLAFGFAAIGAQADEMSRDDLIAAMQEGGNVIYIRHGQTERDYADQVTADPENCATQRVLSETGWQQSRRIGEAFDRLGIPVGSVTSSQFCRAWKTADLAFGTYTKDSALNFEKAETYTDAEFAAMRDRVVPMLAEGDGADTNKVIVGHDDPFEAATGIYPEPQGVTYVLRPDGAGGFKVLGHIGPEEWGDG